MVKIVTRIGCMCIFLKKKREKGKTKGFMVSNIVHLAGNAIENPKEGNGRLIETICLFFLFFVFLYV
jgi:hypothetical protein